MNEITCLAKVINHFRTYVSKDMSILQIAIFLSVAENPGITMQELMRKHTVPQPSISRNVRLLTRHLNPKKNGKVSFSGQDLLETHPAKGDAQSFAVFLTYNGKFLLHEIQDILTEGKKSRAHTTKNLTLVSTITRTGTASSAAK